MRKIKIVSDGTPQGSRIIDPESGSDIGYITSINYEVVNDTQKNTPFNGFTVISEFFVQDNSTINELHLLKGQQQRREYEAGRKEGFDEAIECLKYRYRGEENLRIEQIIEILRQRQKGEG